MKITILSNEDLRTYDQKELRIVVSNAINCVTPIGDGLEEINDERLKDLLFVVYNERPKVYSIEVDVEREKAKKLKSYAASKYFKDKAYDDRFYFIDTKLGFAKIIGIDTRESKSIYK